MPSTFQKYLLSVKRCLRFSAAIQWLHLEAVIHNGWYYEQWFFMIVLLCSASACQHKNPGPSVILQQEF